MTLREIYYWIDMMEVTMRVLEVSILFVIIYIWLEMKRASRNCS